MVVKKIKKVKKKRIKKEKKIQKEKKEVKKSPMQSLAKEIDKNLFKLMLYPVASKHEETEEAKKEIKKIYKKGKDSVKQLILYMIHEKLSQANELKIIHNFQTTKKKYPNLDANQARIQVYRTIFNNNYSIEGMVKMLEFLGELGDNPATKMITYHLSFYMSIENPAMHMLRHAALGALSESNSEYALETLLSYANYLDRREEVIPPLKEWKEKLDKSKIPAKRKKRYKEDLAELFEFAGTEEIMHYR